MGFKEQMEGMGIKRNILLNPGPYCQERSIVL